MSTFALCTYDGQKAIRYYHEYGDFEFFLMQADDGSRNIRYVTSVSLTQKSINAIGNDAIRLIKKTAFSLKYSLDNGGVVTFDDALIVLQRAEDYARRMGTGMVSKGL